MWVKVEQVLVQHKTLGAQVILTLLREEAVI